MYIRFLWSEDWNIGKQVSFKPLRRANLTMMKRLSILYNDYSLHDGLIAPQQHSGGNRMTGRICEEAAENTWEHWTPLVYWGRMRPWKHSSPIFTFCICETECFCWVNHLLYIRVKHGKEINGTCSQYWLLNPTNCLKIGSQQQTVKNPIWYLVPDTLLSEVNKQHGHVDWISYRLIFLETHIFLVFHLLPFKIKSMAELYWSF